MPGKACVTNLLETFDFLTKNFAEKKSIDMVFLDFAKAFDKVSHRRLLYKLEAYGISGNVLKWISAFLSNRIQRVVMGEFMSNWSNVTSGVPQGSVLGPTLFVLFVNDLPSVFKNKCKLYADDCKLMATVDSIEEIDKVQDDINSAVSWSETWLMELNAEKCKIMHIGKNNRSHSYNMLDLKKNKPHQLETTTNEKDLGVYITSKLKSDKHISSAAAKANSILGQLKNTFASRDKEIWKKLYTSFIRPHLEYCVPVWCPHQRGDISELEKVQKRVTKVPTETRRLDYNTRLISFGLTSLETRRCRGDLIQFFKITNNIDTVDLGLKPHYTRDRSRGTYIREIVKNCEERQNFFVNRVVNAWNKLPDYVVNIKRLNNVYLQTNKVNFKLVNDFKRELDKHTKLMAAS